MPVAVRSEVEPGSGSGAKVTAASSARLHPFWLVALALHCVFVGQVWVSSLGPELRDNLKQILAAAFVAIALRIKWSKARRLQVAPSHKGFCVLVGCTVLVLAAAFLNLMDLFFYANIGLFAAFLWAAFGLKSAKLFLPVVFLALFAGPDLPEEFRAYIGIPMQHLSTIMSAELAQLFIPLRYEGHHFFVKGLEYNVAPECGGLSMWSCFLFAFAIWQALKSYRPIAYILAAFIDPILTLVLNMVRLAATAVIAYFGSQQAALTVHSTLEFALVPPGLALLWFISSRFENAE